MTGDFFEKPFHTVVHLGTIQDYQIGVIENSIADPCSSNYIQDPERPPAEDDSDDDDDDSESEDPPSAPSSGAAPSAPSYGTPPSVPSPETAPSSSTEMTPVSSPVSEPTNTGQEQCVGFFRSCETQEDCCSEMLYCRSGRCHFTWFGLLPL
jgi:hypothetical protein